MRVRATLTRLGEIAAMPAILAAAHAGRIAGRPPRFSGAFPDRDTALASLPPERLKGYDNDAVAEISFEEMARVLPWDYPVLFWLGTLARDGCRILDAGGHLGTKYIAFQDRLPLERYAWTILDLPAIVRAGLAAQEAGRIPRGIAFVDCAEAAPAADILLASGLLQYLDIPFGTFVARLPAAPSHILLNKVALRPGRQIVTLEWIGAASVPYCIRSEAAFLAEIDAMGYRIRDRWEISELRNMVPTHPWLGQSHSNGFLLERREDSRPGPSATG